MKQMKSDEFNTLSKDITIGLSPDSLTILHEMGYTNPSEVIRTLMNAKGIDEDLV